MLAREDEVIIRQKENVFAQRGDFLLTNIAPISKQPKLNMLIKDQSNQNSSHQENK